MEFFENLNLLVSASLVVKKSMQLLKLYPYKFLLTTITLILPLSFFQLFFQDDNVFGILISHGHQSIRSLMEIIIHTYSLYNFLCLVFLFVFYVLSASFITFTIASLYISKPISFRSTILSLPRIIKKNIAVSLCVLALKITNQAALSWVTYFCLYPPGYETDEGLWLVIGILAALLYYIIFYVVYLYITALWHLAFVVSVLEPNVWGLSAIKKSIQLLRQKKSTALSLSALYLGACAISEFILYVASGKFSLFGYKLGDHNMLKVMMVVFCAILLAGVNLSGLLVQNVFYYVCKSHQNQVISKEALLNYLEGVNSDSEV